MKVGDSKYFKELDVILKKEDKGELKHDEATAQCQALFQKYYEGTSLFFLLTC